MSDSDQLPDRQSGASLYSVQGIVIGTVLGTLAAGIVMLFLNYRVLGNTNLSRAIALWGSVLCAGVAYVQRFVVLQ